MPRLSSVFLVAPLELWLDDVLPDVTVLRDTTLRLAPTVSIREGVNPRTGELVLIRSHVQSRQVILRTSDGDEAWAQTIADALGALIDYVEDEPLPVPLIAARAPGRWFDRGINNVDEEHLYRVWGDDPRITESISQNGPEWIEPSTITSVFEHLDTVLSSHAGAPEGCGLLHALTYLSMSRSEYAFDDDRAQWARTVGRAATQLAVRDRARAEHAYQDAYKAIEAIMGGPLARDLSSIRRRLRRDGIEPSEVLQLGTEPDAIEDLVARVRATRDTRAAHGGRSQAQIRAVTFLELLEAQTVARHVVARSLERAIGTGYPPGVTS